VGDGAHEQVASKVTESSRISCKSSWLQAPATIYVGLAGDPLPCLTRKDKPPGLVIDLRLPKGEIGRD
jgi:hypothetical protein